MSKKFIDCLKETTRRVVMDLKKPFNFKGFVPANISESNLFPFRMLIESYKSGEQTDAVAILKSLQAVDALSESPSQKHYDVAYASLSRIGEIDEFKPILESLVESMQVKPNDKLKVAGIIADTLGSDSAGSNAEMMVNNALRYAKHNAMMTKGESLKIIQRMLQLATEVGIKYDSKIIGESVKKNDPKYKAGDTVWIKHPTQNWKTLTGDVTRVGRSTYEVKHKDGSKVQYPHADVESDYETLHPNTYKNKQRVMESYAPGSTVTITKPSGKTMNGKVKGVHGSVIEVKHGNNKVSFHHQHAVELSNTLGKQQDTDNTVDQGTSMGANSETHRHQIARKLKGL
jgi:hypothetical protein